uniref:Uncharacterized protein n=1 Tax=Arion vulgaris TaxID=1028688 RepID=A0A0B7A6H3_9EUPU
MEDGLLLTKKRKIEAMYSINNVDNNYKDGHYHNDGSYQSNRTTPGRHFIHLQCMDCETVFHTEDWSPSGSTLFSPLTEDLMINTRNIEQFSCSQGNFFVAGQDGVYSKTISGEVLHLWRFCPQKRKLFISRSFLFKNVQDFNHLRQMLQGL